MKDAIELHIATQDRDTDIARLAKVCENEGFTVIRLFWRGIEPDDEYEEEE